MDYVVLLALTVVVTGVIHYYRCMRPSAEARAHAKQWRRAPSVHDARNGDEAKVVGRVRPLGNQKPFVAPISRRPCVDVTITVYERRTGESGDEADPETCVDVASASMPFAVEDARGAVPILGSPSRLVRTTDTGYVATPGGELVEFFRLHHHGFDASTCGRASTSERRYEEHALLIDTEVAVLGQCVPHADPPAPASDAPAEPADDIVTAGGGGYRDAAVKIVSPLPPPYALRMSEATLSLRRIYHAAWPQVDGDELGDIFPTLILTGLALWLGAAGIAYFFR